MKKTHGMEEIRAIKMSFREIHGQDLPAMDVYRDKFPFFQYIFPSFFSLAVSISKKQINSTKKAEKTMHSPGDRVLVLMADSKLIIILVMSQVDRSVARHVWYQDIYERFPFNIFSGIQSFMFYQNFTDFVGGVVEYPIALVQYPYYLISGQRYSWPGRDSEMQALLNVGRFRSFRSDVI